MRILLDTNVLIDLFAHRDPFDSDAKKFLVMKEFGDAEVWASAKSFTDIFYVLSKKFDSEKIQRAFAAGFQWLDICSIDKADLEAAVVNCWPDFEDCLVDVCAQNIKADCLITRDEGGFSNSKIAVFTPQAFFQMLEDEYDLVYSVEGL